LCPLMLTPFNVMLGIGPPGDIWPRTFVGVRFGLKSSGRSVWPRGSISGRVTPELSMGPVCSQNVHPSCSSAQVPTPDPGFPPWLHPRPLQSAQPAPLHALHCPPLHSLHSLPVSKAIC